MSRITGLATGLDVDAVVKETMQAYRTQIDTVGQEKALVELQQTMYREVITECRDFYNKYFDIGKPDSLLLSKNWVTTKFESSNPAVTVTGGSNAEAANYTVEVRNLAKVATKTIEKSALETMNTININGVDISLSGTVDEKIKTIENSINGNNSSLTSDENEKLKKSGLVAKYSEFSNGLVISTTEMGQNAEFELNGTKYFGENADVTITDGNGRPYRITSFEKNECTIDGVTFKFNNITGTVPAQITGKTDTTAVKDNIVHFVNDYNKLIVKLNTLTSEKRNRDYMPLTDAQKKEMSEKEIELWEAKVKQGQLSRDSDLTRICNSMKKAMRDLVTGVSGDLEKFGIKPVADYSGNNNGTFSIDEDKLNSALENNIEDVKNIFISNGKDYKEKGIVYRLKEILDNETQKSSSSLLQKAGMEGSATASNNTLSRKITAYEKRIKELESNFARREQALYSKYATLETMMNNLNAQMSSLSSMFS